METKVKVGDVMSREFVSIRSGSKLKEAVGKMLGKGVGSLILKDGGELKGLLKEKDVLFVLGEGEIEDLEKVRASDIASKKVATIKPSADIREALKKMSKEKTRWLPVVKDEDVVGYLTLSDIVKVEPSILELYYSK